MTPFVLAKAKSLFASKLFWLGAAEILTGVVSLTTDVAAAIEAGEPVSWALIGKGALTILLRYLTKQPVTVSGKQAKPVEAPER